MAAIQCDTKFPRSKRASPTGTTISGKMTVMSANYIFLLCISAECECFASLTILRIFCNNKAANAASAIHNFIYSEILIICLGYLTIKNLFLILNKTLKTKTIYLRGL